ncbi:MAG: phage major capsid protein [Acidaminococcaceae bacterium]
MRKSIEMKKQLDALKNEIGTLQASGKVADAHAKLDALNELKQAIQVQEALETEEDEGFGGGSPAPVNQIPEADEKKIRNRVFNKQVLGMPLAENEMKYIVDTVGTPGQVGATPAKGGYLLPDEQISRVLEFRRGLTALKNYCEVVPVTRRSGSIPTTTDDSTTLTNFDELDTITKADIDFSSVPFSVVDYGEIIPAAKTLLEDIDVDLVSLIGRRFARKGVRTENSKILALLAALTPAAISDYKDIKTALNKTIDPALVEGSIIITNQSGFDYLDSVVLTGGQLLLQPVITDPTKKQFAGHEIVVLSNAQLPEVTGTPNKIPFYVGNLYEFAKFFDRKQVTIDSSVEAGFTTNALFLRAIERFDVKTADSAAMVYLQLPVA